MTSLLGLTRHESYYRRAVSCVPGDERYFLKELLSHARLMVPYYTAILGTGIDWCAEFGEIPVLTKSIVRDRFMDLRSDDYPARRAFDNASGGSTGAPLRIVQDDEYLDWARASESYFFRAMLGVDFASTRKVVLWGSERDIFEGSMGFKASMLNWLRQTTYLNSFRMSESTMGRYVELINRKRPVFIKAYAGSIYEVACYVLKHGLTVHKPRFVYSAAETLRPFMRECIESVFGCKVHDYYGSREVGAIAGECANGQLHVFGFNTLVEVVDMEGNPVAPGQEGRVLVTTLHNVSMPLIRYEIGDTAIAGEACSCGNPWPTLARVTGRVTDHFTCADGTLVHGEYFTHLFYFRDWVAEFQVLQTAFDCVEIFYVPRQDPDPKDLADIEEKVRLVMGQECAIEWRAVSVVPRTPQGKLLFTRSLVGAHHAPELGAAR
ncbi:MAG: phenylacetate--CoA ligase family protein [Candidatus Sericytochromatia bacterium]|nr:phenylacetate--CoA ligase family protein [Candidatus Tanganyikabacteria bacterium]